MIAYMRITIDTDDSKEEIIKAINLLKEAIENKGSNSNQNEFDLGGLNFNEPKKVETIDLDEPNDEPSQEEVEKLIQSQLEASTPTNQPSSQSSQPTGAFGAMFGGESKNDIFSNDDGFGGNDDNSSANDLINNPNKKEEKDEEWGPRTKMTLGDLERY